MEIYPIPNNSNINTAAKICVVGVGTCGGNQVRDLIERKISGVNYVIANTDVDSLKSILETASNKEQITSITLGKNTQKGLGAGANPEIGKAAAEEAKDEILQAIKEYDIVFVCAGLGKGTGTGAAPYIAKLATKNNSFTISSVVKCASYDGPEIVEIAETGVKELLECSTVIAVSNDKIDELYSELGTQEAYKQMNIPLVNALCAIIKIIHNNAAQKSDLNDIKKVLKEVGHGIIGIGSGTGDNAHLDALKNALNSPFLDNYGIKEKSYILLHFEYNPDTPSSRETAIKKELQRLYNKSLNIITARTYTPDKQEFNVTIIAPAVIIEKNIKQTEKQPNSISLAEEENTVTKQMSISNRLIGSDVEKTNSKYKTAPIRNNQNDLFYTNVDNINNIDTKKDSFNIAGRYNDLPIEQQKEILNIPTALRHEAKNFDDILANEDRPQIHNFVNQINKFNNRNVTSSPFIVQMNKQQ